MNTHQLLILSAPLAVTGCVLNEAAAHKQTAVLQDRRDEMVYEVHQLRMNTEMVPIAYGLLVSTSAEPSSLLRARAFPHAERFELGAASLCGGRSPPPGNSSIRNVSPKNAPGRARTGCHKSSGLWPLRILPQVRKF
jgi:hypothetical protein